MFFCLNWKENLLESINLENSQTLIKSKQTQKIKTEKKEHFQIPEFKEFFDSCINLQKKISPKN